MTTIAFDGETLASDSQATRGDTIVTTIKTKIHDLRGYQYNSWNLLYVAFSGVSADAYRVLDALTSDGECSGDWDITGIILTEQGVFLYERGVVYRTNQKQHALGSGGDFALAAMEAGKDAKEAVKIACKFDVYSGGRIKAVKVYEK